MAKTRDTYELNLDVQQAVTALRTISTGVKGVIGLFAIDKIRDFSRAIINSSSELQNYTNRLRLVTNGTADLERVTDLLRKTAVANRTSFADTVDLFTKLRVSTEALGISEERVAIVTTKLSQALQVAGADGNTASSVIRQFGQAMASGEVRGDEFRSIVEGLGPALAIMARESGLNVGELRKMSREGKLTADVLFNMLENSKSLTAAFESMKPTIGQLEIAFKDAFTLFLDQIGKASRLTWAYEKILKELTVTLNQYAGQTTIKDIGIEEILDRVKLKSGDAKIAVDDAITEIEGRLARTFDIDITDILFRPGKFKDQVSGALQAERDQLKALLQDLNNIKEARDADAEAAKKEETEIRKQTAAIQELLKPYQASLKTAEGFDKLKTGTNLQKLQKERAEYLKIANDLENALKTLKEAGFEIGKDDTRLGVFTTISEQLDTARAKIKDLNREINEADGIVTYKEYWDDLINTSKANVEQSNNIRQALIDIEKQYQSGAISLELFTEAQKLLNKELDKEDAALSRAISKVSQYISDLDYSTREARLGFNELNMTPLERQIERINLKLERDLQQTIAEIERGRGGGNDAEIDKQIERAQEAFMKAKREQNELARQTYDFQRSFQYGWSKAFERYAEDATNAAQKAQRLFEKATQGMEDAIVKFVKTGKFEWADFVNMMAEELLRSNIREIMAGIFSSRSGGGSSLLPTSSGGVQGIGTGILDIVLGGVKSVFGGFFANGGMLGAGKFGIAGENGPELIRGPASVTPLMAGGTTSVTYNINAVDASSFKQLVARDPRFIYAVTEQGRKSVPSTRR